MKIKNNIILALVQAGCLNLTANTLDAKDAYKCIKFRRAVGKAFEALQEAEKGIVKECSLEIGENGVLNGNDSDKEKFGKLRVELYGDDCDLGDVKALSFEAWHQLKQENGGLGNAYIEDNLEGVFWSAPVEA